jgi:hypothetical protein
MTMRALFALLAVVASPAAARDLGTMPLSGQMAIEWLAREDDGEGGFVGRYRIRGGIDGADGEETLLGGFHIACRGTMRVTGGTLLSDEAACRATDRYGRFMWLDLAAVPGAWDMHRIAVRVGDGSGVWRRLSGQGWLVRIMHLGPLTAGPWGFINGTVSWRLD